MVSVGHWFGKGSAGSSGLGAHAAEVRRWLELEWLGERMFLALFVLSQGISSSLYWVMLGFFTIWLPQEMGCLTW